MAAEHELVGRDAECSAIDHLLADARRSAVAACSWKGGRCGQVGAAGIRRGAGGGLRVLRAEGVEPKSDLAFAGLHQLLRPVLDRLPGQPTPEIAKDGIAGALSVAGRLPGEPRTALAAARRVRPRRVRPRQHDRRCPMSIEANTAALLSLGGTPRYDGAGVAQRVLLLSVAASR